MQRNDSLDDSREVLRSIDTAHRMWLMEVPSTIRKSMRRVSALIGYGGVAVGLGSIAAETETGAILPTPVAIAAAVIGSLALGYNIHYFPENENSSEVN